jgi:hypothetical protein
MTEKRPICPIPPDAKVGDIVVLRSGKRERIVRLADDDRAYKKEFCTYIYESGQYIDAGPIPCPHWDCIAFEYHDGRKPNLPHTGKPKRTQAQRDAAYIRYVLREIERREVFGLAVHLSKAKTDRLLKIADRIGGKS